MPIKSRPWTVVEVKDKKGKVVKETREGFAKLGELDGYVDAPDFLKDAVHTPRRYDISYITQLFCIEIPYKFQEKVVYHFFVWVAIFVVTVTLLW